MDARPYAVLPQCRLNELAARAREVLRVWQEDWSIAAGCEVKCLRASEAVPPAAAHAWAAAGETVFWSEMDAGFEKGVERLLFDLSDSADRHLSSELAATAAASSTADLQSAMARLLGEGAGRRPGLVAAVPELRRRGSGAVCVVVTVGQRSARWWLPYAQLRRLVDMAVPPRAGRLHAPLEAVGAQRVKLAVTLGEVELSVGELATLSVGDVVRLSTRLDDPLTVKLVGGESVCNAYIGVVEDSRAIELIRA